MKGERIIAEVLSIFGMVAYLVLVQHLYSDLLREPDKSWLRQLRLWWVTRGSRKMETRLALVWNRKDAAIEPTPGE
jgi:hypothetical protein